MSRSLAIYCMLARTRWSPPTSASGIKCELQHLRGHLADSATPVEDIPLVFESLFLIGDDAWRKGATPNDDDPVIFDVVVDNGRRSLQLCQIVDTPWKLLLVSHGIPNERSEERLKP